VKHETIPAVVQDLMNGRQRIVENWGKGCGLSPPDGDLVCALSAVLDAKNQWDLMGFLRDALPLGQSSIYRYNDHPTTTKQDILGLYDRAIGLALAAHK